MARTPENPQWEGKLRIGALHTVSSREREPGFVFAGESRPMTKLIFVQRGSLHSVAEGHDLLLEQGELVLFGENQWHMYYAPMDVAPSYATLAFTMTGLDIAPLLNRKFTASGQVEALLGQILREQAQPDGLSGDMMLSMLRLLILILLREYSALAAEPLPQNREKRSENRIIRQAQQYIGTHVREKMTVPLVAKQVDVSPSYLTALFHKNLQISPGEYIRRVKLQESKQMIRENELNFTEIAAALQYSTVHHFSRQFKEKFGITPTEYARSVR